MMQKDVIKCFGVLFVSSLSLSLSLSHPPSCQHIYIKLTQGKKIIYKKLNSDVVDDDDDDDIKEVAAQLQCLFCVFCQLNDNIVFFQSILFHFQREKYMYM
jgi:hypothetical protein